jgi:adenine-specific DNA-methyltransferase
MRGCNNQRYFIECPDGSFVIPPGSIFPKELKDGAFIPPQSGKDKVWRWSYQSYLDKKDQIVVKKVRSSNLVDQNGNETFWNVYTKTYLDDVISKSSATPNNFIENHINQSASHELKALEIPFPFAKPSSLIEFLANTCRVDDEDVILDFFSGSASSAHSVFKLNSKDNGKRKFILVQLPELTNLDSDEFKAGFKNICEIGKERIRRSAKKVKEETRADIDYGFRVYRLDVSNMQDVYYRPQDLDQSKMDLFGDNVKPDRTEDDLLAQVMLDWGLPLSLKIEQANVAGKKVFKVAENSLFACFDKGIDEAFAKEIAKEKPLRIVFKDAGFKDDTAKTNVKQLLKQLSPETEMKVL